MKIRFSRVSNKRQAPMHFNIRKFFGCVGEVLKNTRMKLVYVENLKLRAWHHFFYVHYTHFYKQDFYKQRQAEMVRILFAFFIHVIIKKIIFKNVQMYLNIIMMVTCLKQQLSNI